jgi:hypothetical protein
MILQYPFWRSVGASNGIIASMDRARDRGNAMSLIDYLFVFSGEIIPMAFYNYT